ncbi:hypothetical protein HanHA300_Chr06g0217691 [Helianthus annuus]|nr:hypothetical protein HanHA300_Chr06g0217691 [Helianthus annuus]KAJ0574025.1 hypothetical protein HanHA89_Chr06g0233481 [Helianthus annuus]KAJ0738361.1 hypothetical protein HanLR1_Chr06g0217421 [Helianthus annuus]
MLNIGKTHSWAKKCRLQKQTCWKMVTLAPREGPRWLGRDTRLQSQHATELGNPVAAHDRGK